jgi:hypothetical protein
MKAKILITLLGTLAVLGATTGCVNTVAGGKTAAVPFVKDTFSGHYERSLDQVFQAAKSVVKDMGTLVNETTQYGQSNAVKTVQGKINQCNVWIRVEAVEPKITGVAVQTRTKGGGTDSDLTHEIEKQIAVKLAR